VGKKDSAWQNSGTKMPSHLAGQDPEQKDFNPLSRD
jgi:hypothetical protein